MASITPRLRFADSEFARFLDPPTATVTPNLSNTIHPLFQRTMFTSLSDAEYALLQNPLKLATRMLYDDRATKFILGMAEGSLHYLFPNGVIGPAISPLPPLQNFRLLRRSRPPIGPLIPGSQVTLLMKLQAQIILQNLVSTLDRIEVVGIGANGNKTSFSTTPTDASGRAFFLATASYKSMIKLEYYRVWDFSFEQNNSVAQLACHHHLARTLVHEISHVLSVAAHGARGMSSSDVFLDGDLLNEAGFNLERALFGGIISEYDLADYLPNQSATAWGPFLNEYPTQRYIDLYKAANLTIDQLRPFDKFFTMSRISWAFLASMFTEEFWIRDAPVMDFGPIQPSTMRSWVWQVAKQGEVVMDPSGSNVLVFANGRKPCHMNDPRISTSVKEKLNAIATYEGWP